MSARLVLGVVGAAVGFIFGGPQGAYIGFTLGSTIGGMMEDGPRTEGPRLGDTKIQISTAGAPIAELEGMMRLAGNVIWTSGMREHAVEEEQDSGKGGAPPTYVSFHYDCDIAIGLCRGPVKGVRRVWADGKLIYSADMQTGLDAAFGQKAKGSATPLFKLYPGDEAQMPDPTIEAAIGVGNVPAHRGLAYVVFSGFFLTDYGNRIPNFEFEVFTSEPQFAAAVVHDGPELTVPSFNVYPHTHQWSGNAQHVFNFGLLPEEGVLEICSITFNASGFLLNRTIDLYGNVSEEAPKLIHSQLPSMLYDVQHSSHHNNDRRVSLCTYPAASGTARLLVLDFDGGDAKLVSGDIAVDNWSKMTSQTVYGPHAYVVVNNLFSASLSGLYYIDWQSEAPTATLLVSGASLNLVSSLLFANDEGLYVLAGSTIKRYAHGSSVESLSVFTSVGAGSATGFARWGEGYLVETRPSLRYIDQAGTASIIGTTSPQYAAGYVYGFYAAGVWVSPSTQNYYASSAKLLSVGLNLNMTGGPVSGIVQRICEQTGLTAADLDLSALSADRVHGYVRARSMTARAALLPLMRYCFFDLVESDAKLKAVKRGGPAVAVLGAADIGARRPDSEASHGLEVTWLDESELPRMVTLNYASLDADYQPGSQSATRQHVQSVQSFSEDLPIAMTDARAAIVVEVLLREAWANARSTTFNTTRKWARLEPGDAIEVDLVSSWYRLRLLHKSEQGPLITWRASVEDIALQSSRGDMSGVYDPLAFAGTTPGTQTEVALAGPSKLLLMDLPPLRDSDADAGLYAAVSGYTSGWPGAVLYKSTDEGATWSQGQAVSTAATYGTATTQLGDFLGGNVFDELSTVSVRLARGTLSGASELTVLSGANAALLGTEIVQFKTATQLSASEWRLSGLLRGRAGTEDGMASHAIGERFVLLSGNGMTRIAAGASEIGMSRRYRAVTLGASLQSTGETVITHAGAALKPLSPVYLRAGRAGSTDLALGWVRRARIGATWRNSVDVPLDEVAERYDLEIWTSGFGTLKRTVSGLTSPSYTYSTADQVTDFGAAQNAVHFRVYQVSAVVGRGKVAQASITIP